MNDEAGSDGDAGPSDRRTADDRHRRHESAVSMRAYYLCLGVGVVLYFVVLALSDGPELQETCYDCDSDRSAWLFAGLTVGIPLLFIHLVLARRAVRLMKRTRWPDAVVGAAANIAVSCTGLALLTVDVLL